MITHEIQPNLALFELSQITSSVSPPHTPPLSSSAPWQPSATLISKDLEESWGLPLFLKSPSFQVRLFERGAERGPRGLALDADTFPPLDGRLVDSDSTQSPCASLKRTHSLRSAGNLNPYVSMNIWLSCDSLQVFKSRRCAA